MTEERCSETVWGRVVQLRAESCFPKNILIASLWYGWNMQYV